MELLAARTTHSDTNTSPLSSIPTLIHTLARSISFSSSAYPPIHRDTHSTRPLLTQYTPTLPAMSTPSHQKSSSIEATQQELESFLAEADANGESRKSGDLSGSGASINPAQVNTTTAAGAENALKQAAAATAGGGGKVKISPYVISE